MCYFLKLIFFLIKEQNVQVGVEEFFKLTKKIKKGPNQIVISCMEPKRLENPILSNGTSKTMNNNTTTSIKKNQLNIIMYTS